MALPFAVAKDKFEETVPEAQRALYVEDKDVGFRLDVSGIEDPAELRRAKTREAEGRKAAEKALADLQKERETAEAARLAAEQDALKKSGDITALEKSWGKKLEDALTAERAKYEPQVQSLSSDVTRYLIDNVAMGIATKIAVPGSAAIVAEQIQKRLRVETRDGQRVTVVVDAAGKPSAATLAELEKEIVADKALAPLLVASNASGGGANGGKGGGAADDKTLTRDAFEKLSAPEKMAFSKKGGRIVNASQ